MEFFAKHLFRRSVALESAEGVVEITGEQKKEILLNMGKNQL
jgi:hypothetical protein